MLRRPALLLAALAGAVTLLPSPASAATSTTSPVQLVAAPFSIAETARQASTYVVQRGDTLSGIAARYCGHASAYRSIGAASGIARFDLIYPGERITLACNGGRSVATAKKAKPAAKPAAAVKLVAASTGNASGAVAYAMAQVGKPYVFGATGPRSFDCSGLLVAAYARIGITLPHQSGQIMQRGRPVSRAELQPGDAIQPYAGHVMMYIGNGQVVEAANPQQGVRISNLYAFSQARRFA